VYVIPRKKGESVAIGDDIILTVIDVRGDKVRLGVEHPKGGTVQSRELYEAICHVEQDRAVVALETSEPDEDPVWR
jgi:carbon storage regulator